MRSGTGKILFLALLMAGVQVPKSESAERDASRSIARGLAREWKDEAGRVIVRVDNEGRMVLLWWDAEGSLARMAGVAGRVKPGLKEKPAPWGGDAWVHCFILVEKGVVAEIDCVGNRHDFLEPRSIDEARGTTIAGHRHVEEAGSRSLIPKEKGGEEHVEDNPKKEPRGNEK